MSGASLRGTALENVSNLWGENPEFKYHGYVYTQSFRNVIEALGDQRIVEIQASRTHRFNRDTRGIKGGDLDKYFSATQTKDIQLRVDYSKPRDRVPFDSGPIIDYLNANPMVADLPVKEVTFVMTGGDLEDRFNKFVSEYSAPNYTTDKFYVQLHSSLGHERTRENLKRRVMDRHPDWYWQQPDDEEDEERGLDWVPRILAHYATFSEPAFKESRSRGSATPILTGKGRNWTALEFEEETVSPRISEDVFRNGQFHTIQPGFSQSSVCINAALKPFGGSMRDMFRYRQTQEEGWQLEMA